MSLGVAAEADRPKYIENMNELGTRRARIRT
jgi:hypothetical protein